MARELPRVLIALGAVVASVGLVVYAMGIAYREPRDFDVTIGVVLMVGGLVGFVAGLGLHRAGFGGSDRYQVEPAQAARPRQAIHPASADPREAARHDDSGGDPGLRSPDRESR